MNKTAQIKSCQFSGDWKAPNGDIIYYHTLELNNGDVGNVGTAEKYAQKIAVGQTIAYTINNNKIKLTQEDQPSSSGGSSGSVMKPNQNFSSQRKTRSYAKKPEDFLGYCCGYAKDLVVAGKATKKDLDLYKRAAEEIYSHVIGLLQNDAEQE